MLWKMEVCFFPKSHFHTLDFQVVSVSSFFVFDSNVCFCLNNQPSSLAIQSSNLTKQIVWNNCMGDLNNLIWKPIEAHHCRIVLIFLRCTWMVTSTMATKYLWHSTKHGWVNDVYRNPGMCHVAKGPCYTGLSSKTISVHSISPLNAYARWWFHPTKTPTRVTSKTSCMGSVCPNSPMQSWTIKPMSHEKNPSYFPLY